MGDLENEYLEDIRNSSDSESLLEAQERYEVWLDKLESEHMDSI